MLGLKRALPPYFDALIAARHAGQVGRHVHLGYWDRPPTLTSPCSMAEFESAQIRLAERMVELAPLRSGQSVLDVGCGFGGTLAMIGARFNNMALVGINIDQRQLALCDDVGANLVTADACALPFAAESFDHVLCVEAMFHFSSRAAFFAEAARVLRPGGTLTVCDILLRRPGSGIASLQALIQRDYGPWPEPWLGIGQLQQHARDAGLQPIVSEDWTAATLPSYRFIWPHEARGPDCASTAGEAFRWLHAGGWLNYQAMVLRHATPQVHPEGGE